MVPVGRPATTVMHHLRLWCLCFERSPSRSATETARPHYSRDDPGRAVEGRGGPEEESEAMRKTRPRGFDQHKTFRARIRFRIGEYAEGKPWIYVEPYSGDALDLFRHTIGFGLRPGTTYEQAKEIAAFLRRNLMNISETRRVKTASTRSDRLH